MSIPVTFNGNVYPVPEEGEEGWGDLTDYLVALSAAAVTNSTRFGARVATTTPQTLQSTDTILAMNVGSPSVVNLPVGSLGQVYGVVDVSGAAETNNITIVDSGAVTVYIVRSNNGAVLLQYDGNQWNILAEVGNVLRFPIKMVNNSTNPSVVQIVASSYGQYTNVSTGQSCSIDFSSRDLIEINIGVSDGTALKIVCTYASPAISAVSDINNWFLTSDAGNGFFISKSPTSGTITIKNRLSGTNAIGLLILSNAVVSVTPWS